MSEPGETGLLPLGARMALFVVLGVPLVGFLWHSLNMLLNGTIEGWRLVATLPVVLLLAVLLRALARAVERWESPAAK